ncbi:MAPEG family protein [Vibrio sp.]|uniref:MAPEG family protein n=1 Tax=Vibrio sp. TaxID=678 RepID=UPI003AA8BDAA
MLYPMAAMVLLIFIVGCVTLKVRVNSVKNKQVSVKYFQLMQGENLPEMVIKTNRHLANLFEIPVLFYVVCTLYISLQIDSSFGVIVAWLFVIFRYLHSYIHLGTNNVRHRMLAFWASFMCVLALWVNLLIQV